MFVFLLIVVALFNYSSNAALVIIVQNENNDPLTAIAEGSDVILNCSSTGTAKVKRIEWFKDGNLTKIERASRHVSTLRVQNVTANKANAVYKCVARMDNGRNQSTLYYLRVDERPIVYLKRRNVEITPLIKSLTLSCSIKAGWPKPYVRWNTPHGIVNKTDLVIDVDKIPNRTEGEYVCHASNRAGEDHDRAVVTIKEEDITVKNKPPEIIPNDQTVIGYRGDHASLKMKAKLYTPNVFVMSFSWSFRGQQLKRGHKYNFARSFYKTDVNRAEIILTVKNLTLNDSGIYNLIVQTNVGPQANGSRKLEVQDNYPEPTTIHNSTATALKGISITPLSYRSIKTWIALVISLCVVSVFAVVFMAFLARRKRYVFFKGIKKEAAKFDAFISYSSSDYEWVSGQLIPLLDKHHLKYSIHSKDFEIGKTIVDNMADSVYLCKHVVAVVSNFYLESAFCKAELDMAIGRSSISNKPILTIICLDCDLTKKYSKLKKQNGVYAQDVPRVDGDDSWKDELMTHLLSHVSEKII